MTSFILRAATGYLMPLLLLLSVFMLLRGHNEPGGGFIGGLLAAAAFAFHALAWGPQATLQLLRADPRTIIAAGLAAALVAGGVAAAAGGPFLTAHWLPVALPGIGKVGTPLLFDVGVYLVVVGTTTLILLTLGED
ncbi:MAG: Na+/H+ antiporter subunit B [Acidobacteriota bacterium]|jgi:multicomponent Na+:H+ antiporter subunit B